MSRAPEPPAVVVTRPPREALAWAQALAHAGLVPVVLPLMAFAPPTDPDELAQARQRLGHFSAVMFVSPQAVQAFWGEDSSQKSNTAHSGVEYCAMDYEKPSHLLAWPVPGPRCWAPGPGTARALRERGVPAECIDQPPADAPQFDSESLWPVVRTQLGVGDRLLVVRGEALPPPADTISAVPAAGEGDAPTGGSGREWLMDRCRAAGAEVTSVATYRRCPPVWTAAQQAQAQAALDARAVWLLSSSQSVDHLAALMPRANWAQAAALATHPRIADAAAALGFGTVWSSRPSVADVVAALQAHTGSVGAASAVPG